MPCHVYILFTTLLFLCLPVHPATCSFPRIILDPYPINSTFAVGSRSASNPVLAHCDSKDVVLRYSYMNGSYTIVRAVGRGRSVIAATLTSLNTMVYYEDESGNVVGRTVAQRASTPNGQVLGLYTAEQVGNSTCRAFLHDGVHLFMCSSVGGKMGLQIMYNGAFFEVPVNVTGGECTAAAMELNSQIILFAIHKTSEPGEAIVAILTPGATNSRIVQFRGNFPNLAGYTVRGLASYGYGFFMAMTTMKNDTSGQTLIQALYSNDYGLSWSAGLAIGSFMANPLASGADALRLMYSDRYVALLDYSDGNAMAEVMSRTSYSFEWLSALIARSYIFDDGTVPYRKLEIGITSYTSGRFTAFGLSPSGPDTVKLSALFCIPGLNASSRNELSFSVVVFIIVAMSSLMFTF